MKHLICFIVNDFDFSGAQGVGSGRICRLSNKEDACAGWQCFGDLVRFGDGMWNFSMAE